MQGTIFDFIRGFIDRMRCENTSTPTAPSAAYLKGRALASLF